MLLVATARSPLTPSVRLGAVAVHAGRQLPLDRLGPAARGSLGVCGIVLAAAYTAIGRSWLARPQAVDHGTGSTG